MSDQTDEQLLAAYRRGASEAFEELVSRHHDDLMRFLTRLVGSRQVAEDAFQDAFLQVHLSADAFDTSRRFKPWLFTIAANKARDALRRNKRRKALDLSAPISQGGSDGSERTFIDLMEINVPSPDERVSKEETDALVQRAVEQMPWMLREILLLAYFQRLSYTQIADSLDIPLGTVKSRLHAAVASFAKNWNQVTTERTDDRANADT